MTIIDFKIAKKPLFLFLQINFIHSIEKSLLSDYLFYFFFNLNKIAYSEFGKLRLVLKLISPTSIP